jgi:AcrR family transcriptional regulator
MQEKAPRQRAPSKRSVETRLRILDAAERLFAQNTFAGASLRDIAAAADVPVALVNFHGGSKEELYFTVVARRADELSQARLDALAAFKRSGEPPSLAAILECFIRPYLDKATTGGAQWPAYARLIAQVSADERWRAISERCFDPTAQIFIGEILALFPASDPCEVAAAFVFMVAAMLSLATSFWRIDALGEPAPGARGASLAEWSDFLVTYCETAMLGVLGEGRSSK